jgi:hypothetical protein
MGHLQMNFWSIFIEAAFPILREENGVSESLIFERNLCHRDFLGERSCLRKIHV